MGFGVPIDKSFGIPNNRRVKTNDAISHYGSKLALAHALGIKVQSVYDWTEYPPDIRQVQLEMLTAGRLKAEPECYGTARAVPE